MEQPEDGLEHEEHHGHKAHRGPRITVRRVLGVIGFALIAKGYDMMTVPPDAATKEAIDGGIFGVLVVILGAGLAVFAVLFRS